MFDPKKLLEQLLGGVPSEGKSQGFSSETIKGLAGGAAGGGLAAILLGSKGGRKMMTTAVKVGGTAVLGGLAYRAWQSWQNQKLGEASPTPLAMKDVTPASEPQKFLAKLATDDASFAIVRAMISAAKADGHIDAGEQEKIFGRLDALNLDTEAKAFVMDELRNPLNIDAVIASATSPELAVEIYAASVVTIDPDDPAEQAYLAMLSSRLKLDPGLKAKVDQEARLL